MDWIQTGTNLHRFPTDIGFSFAGTERGGRPPASQRRDRAPYRFNANGTERGNAAPHQNDSTAFTTNATSCHYVFLVEDEWFTYTDRVFLNRTDDFAVPLVLDWAVRNIDNCSAAGQNATDFACRSVGSQCVDATNGPGYRCSCPKGYDGNPYLDSGCADIDECHLKDEYPCYGVCTNTPGSHTCQCPPGTSGGATAKNGCRPKDNFTLALKTVIGVSVGVFLSVFMCFWLYLGLQKRKLIKAKRNFFEHNGGVILQQQMRSNRGTSVGGGGGFKIFSEEELEKATNNFATDQVLGRGGHGIVYKGVLEDETVVAIKKSKMMEKSDIREFAREMLILSQINHRNVVKLLGCCLDVEVPMLVYEYVSNGTLYHFIHGKELNNDTALDTLLRIAAESAEALAYMHTSASPPILHGDVKTANILLDSNLTAKVSDFGASKLAPSDEVQIATLVQGTCGYLDPEYLMTCQLTDKSDVYSFGVVLLELLTGKKAICFSGPEDRSLVSRFIAAVKAGTHEKLLDVQVRKEMGPEALEEVTHIVTRKIEQQTEQGNPASVHQFQAHNISYLRPLPSLCAPSTGSEIQSNRKFMLADSLNGDEDKFISDHLVRSPSHQRSIQAVDSSSDQRSAETVGSGQR
ncbi:Wall-associated receptor kinase 5 [Triticum urartu]|uniref:Wall-associated receptor kinase 5 n=1 Tax=Triticum urartu TaxID=4572 RepID=M7ZZQ8_TRIUA|nr:Wall-associated receptor kinase 5 [Triticum urartu]